MSDFFSGFWPWYISVIVIASICYCAFVLWSTSKIKVKSAADNTTGHVWDGDLREMNNPLPKWWVGLFILTIVFSIGYILLYPTLGPGTGQLGWSSAQQHVDEGNKLKATIAPIYAKFQGMSTEQIARDPQAQITGERLYQNFCAQCHGSDARGSKGFPNLTDKDWLGAASAEALPEHIKNTIANGRIGVMPPMAAAVGSPEDVRNVAQYVLSLSGSPHDSVQAALGKPKFAACAACHGADGKGNAAVGAPNLTDGIWLHGYGAEAIIRMINEGKQNVMPAQKSKLTDEQLQVLTGYVWSLSNKQ